MTIGRILVLLCCSSLAACGAQASSHPSPAPAASAAPARTSTASMSSNATNASLISAASTDPTASGPFTCTFPVTREPSGNTLAQPTTARVAGQPGFDRIVFEYSGTSLPWLVVNSAAPPFTHDPSGKPLAVSGKVFLSIVFPKVPGVTSGYSGPTSFKAGLPVLTDLEQSGDFEGVQRWVAGLSEQACVRVFSLANPSRLVIDLESSSSPGLPTAGHKPS